jgi:hypothetical protein
MGGCARRRHPDQHDGPAAARERDALLDRGRRSSGHDDGVGAPAPGQRPDHPIDTFLFWVDGMGGAEGTRRRELLV